MTLKVVVATTRGSFGQTQNLVTLVKDRS